MTTKQLRDALNLAEINFDALKPEARPEMARHINALRAEIAKRSMKPRFLKLTVEQRAEVSAFVDAERAADANARC